MRFIDVPRDTTFAREKNIARLAMVAVQTALALWRLEDTVIALLFASVPLVFLQVDILKIPARSATGRYVRTGSPRFDTDDRDPAVARAIEILTRYGLAPRPLPRFRIVEPSEFAEYPIVKSLRAFRIQVDNLYDPVVYIVRTNGVYQLACRGDDRGIALLAATLLHEIVHGIGADETAAMQTEVQFLRRYILLEKRDTASLMWHVFELERRLGSAQSATADTLHGSTADVERD
jgi:hypothetical protein